MDEQGKYYEDFEPGQSYTSPWRVLSESHFWRFADITRLNEPLFEDRQFVSEEVGTDRWLIPGWLTAGSAIGLFIRSGWFHGTILAILEVNNLKWENPTYTGDEIRANVEVLNTRPTSSERGGVVELEWEVENRAEEAVMTMTSTHFLKKKG